jgi:hypothetical protein
LRRENDEIRMTEQAVGGFFVIWGFGSPSSFVPRYFLRLSREEKYAWQH